MIVTQEEKNLALKKWRANNPEKQKILAKRSRAKRKDKISEYGKRYYAANSVGILARQKERYADDPGKFMRATRKWAIEHPEQCNEIAAKWRSAHPEERRKSHIVWKEKCPENYKTSKMNSRYKRYADIANTQAEDRIKPWQWRLLLKEWGGQCAYCGNDATTIDHVVPLSKGGTHKIDNVLPACRYCNNSKNAKGLAEWKGVETVYRDSGMGFSFINQLIIISPEDTGHSGRIIVKGD